MPRVFPLLAALAALALRNARAQERDPLAERQPEARELVLEAKDVGAGPEDEASGGAEAIPKLLRRLAHRHWEERAEACWKLGELRSAADPILEELLRTWLEDGQWQVRHSCRLAYQRIGSPPPTDKTLERLLRKLERPRQPRDRQQACEVLGNLRTGVDRLADRVLLAWLHDERPGLHNDCQETFKKIKAAGVGSQALDEVARWLKHERPSGRRMACEVLAELGPAAARALPALQELDAREDQSEVKQTCQWAAGEISGAAQAPIPRENQP